MRKTSEVTDTCFPFSVYANPTNTYIAVYKTGEVKVLSRYKSDKLQNWQILTDVKNGLATVYISWVGRYRTDVFECDTVKELIAANM